jgi:alpha-N-arabinofuranosidase
VKVVNPTEKPATLRIKGDWNGVERAPFEYYAPGSLTVANSMQNKQAVTLKQAQARVDGADVVLSVPALSAGVLVITKKISQ